MTTQTVRTVHARSTRPPHPLEDVGVAVHRHRIYLSVRNSETQALRRADVAALIDRLCEAVKEADR